MAYYCDLLKRLPNCWMPCSVGYLCRKNTFSHHVLILDMRLARVREWVSFGRDERCVFFFLKIHWFPDLAINTLWGRLEDPMWDYIFPIRDTETAIENAWGQSPKKAKMSTTLKQLHHTSMWRHRVQTSGELERIDYNWVVVERHDQTTAVLVFAPNNPTMMYRLHKKDLFASMYERH